MWNIFFTMRFFRKTGKIILSENYSVEESILSESTYTTPRKLTCGHGKSPSFLVNTINMVCFSIVMLLFIWLPWGSVYDVFWREGVLYHTSTAIVERIYLWFKMTFWFPSWRSLNLWKGHLNIPKRSQRIARMTMSRHFFCGRVLCLTASFFC